MILLRVIEKTFFGILCIIDFTAAFSILLTAEFYFALGSGIV